MDLSGIVDGEERLLFDTVLSMSMSANQYDTKRHDRLKSHVFCFPCHVIRVIRNSVGKMQMVNIES